MTKDLMLKEVAERATDIMTNMADENATVKKFTKKEVAALLQAYAECVIDNLVDNKDEKIPMPGIGTFSAKHVAEKSGVATLAGGKAWTVPEHDEVKFTITKSVKTLA